VSTFHLINVWSDPEAAGGFNPMSHSLLWLPDGYQTGQPTPAFVFIHAWGGYPHDDLAQTLGPAMADRGYAFLSLCLRRRGGEGQLMALPENDRRDIKLAVDYLAINGCEEIYLIGEEVGAWSALDYQTAQPDPRVKGICIVDPVDDLSSWLRASLGGEAYDATVREAAVAARQGAGMDYRIDCLTDEGPQVAMQAAPFLAWWSPMAKTLISRCYNELHVPLLIFAESEQALPECLANDDVNGNSNRLIARHFGDRSTLVDLLAEGAWHLGSDPLDATGLELVNIDVDDRSLYGFFWQPQQAADTAILLMHGLTSSPTSVLFQKMAPVLAQDVAVLAVESHRSGWTGHESALLDDELGDFDGWLKFLSQRGIKNVVLAGASMGSISIGRYYSVRQPAEVVALAHLMPTADCPDWFCAAAGNGPYEAAVASAEAAVADGNGETFLVDVDVRQPPPSLSKGRFRWTQRAASWLSWWGPDADSRNSVHIVNADVPLLLLSGTADSYNDAARFAELKEAAVNAPSVEEVWYEDIDHGLAGVERKVAADLRDWLKRTGLL